jgi:protein-disulfide isomerase
MRLLEPLARRTLLGAAALLPVGPALAQDADPRLGERGIGRAEAPVRVLEFFSLTCSHCAAFHRETYPQVKRDFVETGTVRLVWRDFPLDQLALTAAMVARSLPAERYEGFIGALLASQDRWAFARGADPLDELARMAALAGMGRPQYDQVRQDEALRRGILEQRLLAEREYSVQSTPSFAFIRGTNTRNQSGSIAFDRFRQLVEETNRS